MDQINNPIQTKHENFYESEEPTYVQGEIDNNEMIQQFQKRIGNQDQYYEYVDGSEFQNSDKGLFCLLLSIYNFIWFTF